MEPIGQFGWFEKQDFNTILCYDQLRWLKVVSFQDKWAISMCSKLDILKN